MLQWLLFSLFAITVVCQQVSAQTLADPRPANRRICDVNVTIVRGQSFTRNAQQDQLSLGSCTGTFTGTANFARGFTGPNVSDAGINDLYPTNGTTAPVSSGPPSAGGRWGTADGTYDFTYTSNAASGTGTTTDNFEVDVVTTAGRDSARIYYHVTITSPSAAVAPTVSEISPASAGLGAAPGLVLTGTGFTDTTSVTFGGVAATQFTVDSDTQITATAPAASTPGTRAVVVTTTNGSSNATISYRQYTAATNAAGFAPAAVQIGEVATLTFTLSNPGNNPGSLTQASFSAPIPANLTVTGPATTCGGTVAMSGSTISLSGGTLAAGASCTVTASASSTTGGSYSLTPAAVSAQGTRAGASGSQSTVTGATGTAANLTVSVPAPTITTVAPTSGPAAGGTVVVITGTGFSGTTAVAFGDTAAASFTIDSSTQISAISPARSAGTIDVTVTTPGGGTTATGGYTFVAAPILAAVSPSSGATGGGISVVITGTGLSGATAVTFGGVAATGFVVNSATQITATTPASTAGAKTVAVTTPGGTAALADGYTYVALSPPAVTIQPADQTVALGTSATFTANASGAPSPSVQWQVSSDSGATFTNIAGATATSYTTSLTTATDDGRRYRAVFTNSAGNVTSIPATLSVVQAPLASDQVVTAVYQTVRTITLAASDPNTPPRPLTYTVLTVPAHGTLTGSGNNRSYTPAAGYSGPDSFTFSASNGVADSNVATISITVQAPAPVVTSVSPVQGSTTGGTVITIDGSGFTGVTGVTIGGAPASAVTVANDTRITATTPAGPAGQASVVVTTATGTNTSNTLFTYVAPATANGQTVAVVFNTARAVTLTGTDTPTGYTVVAAPAHGTLSGTAPNLTYTPNAGFNGTDSFTFTVSNAAGTSAPATVTLNVAPAVITIAGAPPAGTRGVAYSTTLTASGGTSPYSFGVAGGALPPGLSLSSAGTTAILSGTPTASGSFTVAIRTSDSSNPSATAEANYTIAIGGPTLTINPGAGTLPTATVGAAYSRTMTAAGGTAPYSYAVTAGALPPGITLAPNGTLSGTPNAGGTFSFQVTATDSSANGGPYTASASYSLTVGTPLISLAPATLPNGAAGTAYTQTLTANGGIAPYSFAMSSGTLPTGLTLSSTGALSGTPSRGGSFTFTVTATDASSGTGPYSSSRSYTVTIAAPAITLTPATIPAGTVAQAYAQTVTATGGTAPYSYAITAGTLPPGLTLGSSGALAGTPTAGGTFNFSITGSDANGFTGSRAYSLTIAAPSLTLSPTTLAAATRNIAYSQTVSTEGGIAPYSYAITAGALPAGVTLASNGTIAGTPNQAGSFAFTVTVTDASTGVGPYTANRSYTLVVAAPAISIAPATLPSATPGIAYGQALSTSGGVAPYTYAVTAGTLPRGITLAANGMMAGTPATSGSFAFTATATDANGNAGNRAYTLVVNAPTITITPALLPGGTVAQAYAQTLSVSGGTAPYSYAVTAGAMPAGVTISSDGTLSGTPTVSGTFNLTVTATDAQNFSASRSYTLTIAVQAPVAGAANATVAANSTGNAVTLALSGGAATSVAVVSSPSHGTATAAGTSINYTPTAGFSGTDSFTYTATNASGTSVPATVTVTVTAPTFTVSPASGPLPSATVGSAFTVTLTSSGGNAPYSYTATGLPAGITLSAGGTFSGTPTTPGNYTVTVTITDANGATGTASYTLAVAAQVPVAGAVTTTVAAYSTGNLVTLALSGGTATSVAVASSPSHGTATASGTSISYTPTEGFSGTDGFTYIATNASGTSVPATVTVTVTAPTLTVSPASGPLPSASVGSAFTVTLATSRGSAPYSYTATGLPAGITLSAAGTLSGTPTTPGNSTVVVSITDANGATGTASYTLTVAVQAPAAGAVTTTVAANSTSNAVTLALSGGAATSVAVASSPSHGIATPSGTSISYTPTAGFSGTDSFSYTATNASGTSVPAIVTVTVTAPTLTVSPASGSLPSASVGSAFTTTLTSSGGTAPYSYTATGLPAGINLSAGGTLSGTPTTPGNYTVNVAITDANGATGTASYTLTVAVQAPAAGAVATTVAANSTGNAVTLALTGGTAESVAVASQPLHGTATASGTSISYTPTAGFSGTDSFTYIATNTSGTSTAATVTVTVTAPTLTVSPASGPLPSATVGSAFTTTLSSSGGSAPYSYTANGLPAGIRLSSGGTLSGTPTTPGNYTVTVTITDANGATGTAGYALTVAAQAPVAGAVATTVAANTRTEGGQSVSLNLSSLVTGQFDDIRIVTLPTHGTVTISRTLALRGIGGSPLMAAALAMSSVSVPSQIVAVYTPEAGYQGTDAFQYVAVGPGGTSAPETVTIQVVGEAPTVQGITVSEADGQPVSIDLTAGASGGPFTAATITSVSPADQATATIVSGGTADARTFRLQVEPKAHFSGTIAVGYTLANTFGTSPPATVTITVTARPDPSRDANVRAMSDAQAEAARRFSRTQVANFMGHAETLHGDDCAKSVNGLRVSSTDRTYEQHVPGQPTDSVTSNGERRTEHTPEELARKEVAPAGCSSRIGFWAGGTIDIGTRDAITGRSKIDATTSGLSAGVDLHVAKGITLGVGGGLGHDRSSVAGAGGQVNSDSQVLAIYGSVAPLRGLFVDGMIARGWLDYSLRRYDAGAGALATANRAGTFTTGALSSGIDRTTGALRWSVYGRAEYLDGHLSRYIEEGAGVHNLRFDDRDLLSVTGALGLRLGWQQPLSVGLLTGRLRTEWLHEFAGGTGQGLDYADMSGPSYYSLIASGWSREQFMFAPGIGLTLPSGWDVGLDLGVRIADGERAATTGVQVRKKF